MAKIGLLILVPTPALLVLQGYYQAEIMIAGHTRRVTEAMILNVMTLFGILYASVLWGKLAGIYAMFCGTTVAIAVQTFWLWRHGWQRDLHYRESLREAACRATRSA